LFFYICLIKRFYFQPFCQSESDYDRDAPTKQNNLCKRKSSKEVVLDHDDFKLLNSSSSKPFAWPSFNFVVSTYTRFVLVIDTSQAMTEWETTRNAIFRLISHIPEGHQLAIVTFGSRARLNVDITTVTDDKREGLFGRIPFQLLNDPVGCAECGLDLAADLLLQRDESGTIPEGQIIVITDSKKVSLAKRMESVRRKLTEENEVPVFSVSFEPQSQEIIDLTIFGASYEVQKSTMTLMQTLNEIFINILGKKSNIAKSFEEYFDLNAEQNGTLVNQFDGTFVVEDELRRNLWVVLTSPMKDVELFEIISPSGSKFSLPKVENGIIYFHLKGAANEFGVWSYRIKLYDSASGGTPMSVEVFGEPTDTNSVKVESWTNVPSNGIDVKQNHVIIYASVNKGDVPVNGAEVYAMVYQEELLTPVKVALRDDGNGYPDITKGDGIYSAYFTDFTPKEGLYSIRTMVTDADGQAAIPRVLEAQSMECCGSDIGQNSYAIPTGSFKRFSSAPSFLVTKGIQFFMKNGEPEVNDVFPPSRISDFYVSTYVNQTLYATLSWSAPGGNLDKGRASRYEMRCYTNAEALTGKNFLTMGIPVHESLLPVPSDYGMEQSATVGLPWANELFYYGIVAYDEAGNRGEVSNLVPVFATESTTFSSSEGGQDENSQSNGGSNAFATAVKEAFGGNNIFTYIVAGGVSGLFLILLVIVVVSVVRCKRRNEEKHSQKERTQIFVNDIETTIHSNGGLPDLSPEKVAPNTYGEVWSSNEPHATSHITDYSMYGGVNHDQATWSYHQQAAVPQHHLHHPIYMTHPTMAPVHDYKTYFDEQSSGEIPTYQNWQKPPSDNGTATTSSTECQSNFDEHSDNSENNNHKCQTSARAQSRQLEFSRRYSEDAMSTSGLPDPSTLSLSPSFSSEMSKEKRRRQESLV